MPLTGGSPPPPPSYAQLITGNDSEFTSAIGAWVNTGGTQSRDTSIKYGGAAASLKLVTSAAGHRTDLPVAGTFKAGAEYALFLAINLEETGVTAASLKVQFGLVGTDAASTQIDSVNVSTRRYGWSGSAHWAVVGLRWQPTATRTGVSVRVERHNADSSNTQTWHVGWAKAFRIPTVDGAAVLSFEPNSSLGGEFHAPLFLSGGQTYVPSSGRNTGLWVAFGGDLGLDGGAGVGGIEILTIANPTIYGWMEHTAADLAGLGINLEVGTDYVGLQMSEKDSGTVQFYADVGAGYMMQLRHRGSGKGWSVSDDGTINARIESFFEWQFNVAGTLTTGTDKALHVKAGYKCRIDEVQIHVKTAPTGQSIIVDVNDDGTTIFTTQGNRPEIAASATDDTSGAPDGGTSVAKDSLITIDIDQIGSGVAGADLSVSVRGRVIW